MFFRKSVSIRCQGYIGDFVLGCHANDMVDMFLGNSCVVNHFTTDFLVVLYTILSLLICEVTLEKWPILCGGALQAPPSPDYVPGPEEPEQAPPSPDYVPGPEHTDDEIVAEDQPGAEDASPTAQSPDYVSESDPEADPEEGADEDEEEEGAHQPSADSVVVALPIADQAPSAKETEPFETDESTAKPPPHPAYRVSVGISIQLIVLHQYGLMLRLPSPSLPLSPPSPVLSPAPPPSPIRSLGYRAAMIRLRAEAISIPFSTITTTLSYSPLPDQMLHIRDNHHRMSLIAQIERMVARRWGVEITQVRVSGDSGSCWRWIWGSGVVHGDVW
ncbi:hypothetical protein Tco_0572444 [Tanacetum coccineum]